MKSVIWKTHFFCWLLICTFVGFSIGCSPAPLPTVPIQGKATWQGQPLTKGKITFQPVKIAENLPNRPSIAELDSDGAYRVSSFGPNDGLLPGEYRVTVHSYTSRPTFDDPKAPFVWRIPERYGDPAKSGLALTVPADARRAITYDIDIK